MKDGDKYLLTYREDINCLVDESGEKVVFMGVKDMNKTMRAIYKHLGFKFTEQE
jgi:hypothetical protein